MIVQLCIRRNVEYTLLRMLVIISVGEILHGLLHHQIRTRFDFRVITMRYDCTSKIEKFGSHKICKILETIHQNFRNGLAQCSRS